MAPTKSSLAAEVIRENPRLASRAVARALICAHPGKFKDLEQARNVVRHVRDAQGTKRRTPSKEFADLQEEWQKELMPESWAKQRKDFHLGKGRVLVLSDVHVPWHDRAAVELAIEHGKKKCPDVVYLNGDIADFYQVSDHDKTESVDFKSEVLMVRQFLFWIRKQFPKSRIIYKTGNHEYRMERYLRRNAVALTGMDEFKIPDLLKFRDMGIEHIESLQICKMGKLPVIHGHELAKGSGVNPARWLWLKLDETALCGHFHSSSEHIASTGLKKKILNTWSLGCLCDLTPDYALTNRWNHGFAEVEIDKSGEYEVRNHKIIKGSVR